MHVLPHFVQREHNWATRHDRSIELMNARALIECFYPWYVYIWFNCDILLICTAIHEVLTHRFSTCRCTYKNNRSTSRWRMYSTYKQFIRDHAYMMVDRTCILRWTMQPLYRFICVYNIVDDDCCLLILAQCGDVSIDRSFFLSDVDGLVLFALVVALG